MHSGLVKIIVFCGLIIFNGVAALAADTNNVSDDDYDADYMLDEGRLLFKARGYGIFSNGKQSGLPAPTVANQSKVEGFVKNGFGFDTASTIFFNDNIGIEGSLGFQLFRVKSSGLNTVSTNYGGAGGVNKRRNLYGIPLSGTVQYHIAPFGGIRPYLGAGYHFTYMYNKVKQVSVNHGHGPILQAGVDLVAKDDTLITIDVRQYYMKPKVKYKSSFTGASNIASKVKFDPLIISAGIGFKF